MVKIQRVGILMGGFSSEREISLKSGNAVVTAFKEIGWEPVIFDFKSPLELIQKLKNEKVDCVFNALHGRFGEDGQVQGILEELKIPYTGSGAQASRLAMDKIASRQIFQKNGLIVPEYRVFTKISFSKESVPWNFPLVVKPAHEGSSIGLSIVDSKESLSAAVEKAFSFDDFILVEKYISGREVTVGILDDTPLPLIEIAPKNKFYDFSAKYTAGMTEYKIPADFEEDVAESAQNAALCSHQLLGCYCFSRVDIIIGLDNNPFVLEVNTIPGLTSTSLLPKAAAAVGIGFTQLCQRMVFSALEKDAAKAALAK